MTVLVADDHPIYIEGLANLLRSYDFTVIGKAKDGLEAVRLAEELKPDVVLMDANMPEMDGIEATKKIKENAPNCKVIILTGIEDDSLLMRALDAGASGFLLKKLDGESLHKNLLELQAGRNPFSPGIEALFSESTANEKKSGKRINRLTVRDEEILKKLSRGMTYKEIGAEIHLSEAAVKYNVKRIKEQSGAQTQAELIGWYRDQK